MSSNWSDSQDQRYANGGGSGQAGNCFVNT